MIYAGIGPRNTPEKVRDQMTVIGSQLEKLGFILSSGDGIGADQAWAEEVDPKNSRIFIVDKKPNCPHGVIPDFLQDQWDFANRHFGKHRGGLSLTTQSAHVQYLFMRNLNILMGADLTACEPVDFVAYWYEKDCPNGWAGGTGHTVSMARDPDINIPCFNIALDKDREEMDALVDKLIKEK
ncbi:MAG: hypothetical protein ACK5LG_21825 [Bacteroides thetaiotaomicron]